MSGFIRVEVTHLFRITQAEQQLKGVASRLQPGRLRKLMQGPIYQLTRRMIQRHFESEGRAFRRPWAPLAPSTLAAKRRAGVEGKGILRFTDHLYRSLLRSRPADSRLKQVANGVRLALNTGVRYAIFHQVGTRFMPDRQVIPDPLPRSFIDDCRATVRLFVLTGRMRAAV